MNLKGREFFHSRVLVAEVQSSFSVQPSLLACFSTFEILLDCQEGK